MKVFKYYDADAAEIVGGGASIAQLMAQHGKVNSTGEVAATPIQIGSEGTTKADEVTPVATTTETTEAKVTTEEPKPQTEVKEAAKPQEAVEAPKQPSLQEVLKNQQPEAILKELGYDESAIGFLKELKDVDPKMLAFFNTWKTNGDVTGYLKELTTDYSKMSAEEVMRHQLRLEYPTANDRTLDVLFKKEILEKYNLDSSDDDEAEEGKLLLEAKAEKYRQGLIEKQNEYLLPKPQEKSNQIDPEEQKRREIGEKIVKDFSEDSYTKSILSNNTLNIGEGEDAFSFPIDAKEVVELVLNGDKDGSLMFDIQKTQNGIEYKPKAQHQILVATVQKYGINFLNEYAKHYKSLGGKSAIDPIENAKLNQVDTRHDTEPMPTSVAGLMAKKGTYSSGG